MSLPDHLVEGGVPGSPRGLCFTLGRFEWIWKQVSLHVRVGISAVFRHLSRSAYQTSANLCVCVCVCVCVCTRSLMCMTMMNRVLFL